MLCYEKTQLCFDAHQSLQETQHTSQNLFEKHVPVSQTSIKYTNDFKYTKGIIKKVKKKKKKRGLMSMF